MNLHIVEISPAVHAGYVNKRAELEGGIVNTSQGYKNLTIPTGGVAFLFNKIYDYGHKDKMVFVADRYPAKKVAMDPAYKGQREYESTSRQEKHAQMKITELVLKNCGYEVLEEEGYEADDLVYSLCQKYKSQFNKIYVHTVDSDLYINVDDNVEIIPTHSRGKYINKENYRTEIRKDAIIPYNSLSFSKVLYGDSSDNIKPLPKPLQEKMRSMFYTEFYYGKMADKKFMRELVSSLVPEALAQFDLVYPLEPHVDIDIYNEPDMNKIAIWGSLVGNNKFPRANYIPEDIRVLKDSFFKDSELIEL